MAVGREPAISKIGLEKAGVLYDEKTKKIIGANQCRLNSLKALTIIIILELTCGYWHRFGANGTHSKY